MEKRNYIESVYVEVYENSGDEMNDIPPLFRWKVYCEDIDFKRLKQLPTFSANYELKKPRLRLRMSQK